MAVTIFVFKASEIKGKRWDSQAYISNISDTKSKYDYVLLKNCIQLSNTNWDQKSFYQDNFPYIQISNIDTVCGTIFDIEYPSIQNIPSRARQITYTEDIIVSATRPHRGGIAFISDKENQFIVSTGFFIIRDIKEKIKIDKKYLFHCLKRDEILLQMEQKSSGGNYPAITKENFLTVQIPIPPMPIQKEIACIMDNAYSEKKRLEAEAKELLNSIDSYVMDKLGIIKTQETKPTEKWFTVKASDIHGKKWQLVQMSSKEQYNYKYPLHKLMSVANILMGQSPLGNTYNDKSQGMPFYQGKTLFSDKYILEPTTWTTEPKKTANYDDILMSVRAPVGNVNLCSLPKICIGRGLASIKAKENVNQFYLFYILDICKHLIKGNHGATFEMIASDELANSQIPIPPQDIQKEIAKECEERRNSAKQKQELSSKILLDAKEKVEAMLFN